MISPLISPTKLPAMATPTMARPTGMPALTASVNTTAPSGTVPLTERSKPPEMIVSAWPSETMPITVTLLSTLSVFE